jgi:hypothetical protein
MCLQYLCNADDIHIFRFNFLMGERKQFFWQTGIVNIRYYGHIALILNLPD